MAQGMPAGGGPRATGDKGKHGGSTGGLSRYASLPRWVKVIFLTTNMASILLFIFHWFAIPINGVVLSGTSYYYLLFSMLGFNTFMGLAISSRQRGGPRWYDYVLGVILTGCLVYFLFNSDPISRRMWEPPPGALQITLAILVAFISLEAGRRIAGWGYVAVIVICVIYPLFADQLPGVLYGFPLKFETIMADFAFGADGILGLPGHILGELILGFYIFAGFMVGLGGGEFFLKLAVALMGQFRGGPAKVAVLASGFFGSLSGNAIANIVGTGSFTIPAMKKMGYPPHYAGAIEACASTGGAIMPPVLGAMAFTSCVIAGIPYTDMMIAAFIPAVLYYLGLIVQVDCFAARSNFVGLPRADIPRLGPVLRDGWPFIVTLAFLTVGMVYFRWGDIAPVYAVFVLVSSVAIQTVVNIVLNRRRSNKSPGAKAPLQTNQLTWKKMEDTLVSTSGLINFGVGIFLSMGLIMVSLYKTGMAAALTSWIVNMASSSIYLILLAGVLFLTVMGMIGLQSTAHLFLAVTMAPAIVKSTGVPPTAAHLFIISYAILGGLTPPVAINAFVAAALAGASPMRTAWTACRLGIVLFFMPFFFVLQPNLVMSGDWYMILYHALLAILGVWILASALEGFLLRVGKLRAWERIVLFSGGFMIAFPDAFTTWVGLGACALAITIHFLLRRRVAPRPAT
jgi:TRAP transporter 4TM/12TM fusion protein